VEISQNWTEIRRPAASSFAQNAGADTHRVASRTAAAEEAITQILSRMTAPLTFEPMRPRKPKK
jgi:hypothetical protein